MKSDLFRFIESQMLFSTSCHSKMSLALLNRYRMFFVQASHTTSKHAPKTYRTRKVLYAKQPTPDQNSCWSEDNYCITTPALLKKLIMCTWGVCGSGGRECVRAPLTGIRAAIPELHSATVAVKVASCIK